MNPESYREIISNYGTVLKLGENCPVADFKGAAEKIFNNTSNWHFKITECKRIFIKRNKKRAHHDVLVRGEPVYKHDIGEYRALTKQKLSFERFNPEIIDTCC